MILLRINYGTVNPSCGINDNLAVSEIHSTRKIHPEISIYTISKEPFRKTSSRD